MLELILNAYGVTENHISYLPRLAKCESLLIIFSAYEFLAREIVLSKVSLSIFQAVVKTATPVL